MVEFGDGRMGAVSLNEPVLRYQDNPILTAPHVNDVWTEPHLRVVTVHNAGVAVVGSETVMLFRSHLRCGISVLGTARSDNGVTDWRDAPPPLPKPPTTGEPLPPRPHPPHIHEEEGRRGGEGRSIPS